MKLRDTELNKAHFNILSEEEKKSFFREEFESEGAFSGISQEDSIDINTKEHSLNLRNEILRLLEQKGIIQGACELENLHELLDDEMREYNFVSGVNKISQFFYENDKQFEDVYLRYIKYLYQEYFKFPFYFQKVPTIRLHCPNGKNSHHYPRYHTDIGYGHPPQEINLWVPLTNVIGEQKHGFRFMDIRNTRKILNEFDYDFPSFIDKAINDKGFNKELDKFAPESATRLGDTMVFDARCLHTGEPLESHTRVSIDVRIISVENYNSMKYRFQGAGKRKVMFESGACYHELPIDRI